MHINIKCNVLNWKLKDHVTFDSLFYCSSVYMFNACFLFTFYCLCLQYNKRLLAWLQLACVSLFEFTELWS